MIKLSCYAAVLVVLIISAIPVPAETVSVRVHCDTAYSINGVERIQSAIFGVTAYEGATRPAKESWREVLAKSGISCLGFPQNCVGPPESVRTKEEILDYYSSDAAVSAITEGVLNGRYYLLGRILPKVRELGIEPMIYVFDGKPKFPKTPQEFETYAASMAGFVGVLKRVDPKLRLVHILNEPNVYFFNHGYGGEQYAKMFTAAATAIKKKFPDVLVGGPVMCWPPTFPHSQDGHKNWYQWDSYTMPLIDIAGETLDFFDYHYYGLDPALAAEEVLTVTNAMYLKRGRRVPVAITECGNYMKQKDWADTTTHFETRTLGMQRLIMMYLDRPGSVITMQLHDLSAMAGGSFKFLKTSDPDDQLPTYYMYQVWRHFRGRRLPTSHDESLVYALQPGNDRRVSSDMQVKVMAAHNGKTAVCMVFNDGPLAREVDISLDGLMNTDALDAAHNSARWECIYLDKAENRLVRAANQGRRFLAQPYSTHAVRFDLPERWQTTRRQERIELFGKSVMNEFTEVYRELDVAVEIPEELLADTVSARVRVGLLGSQASDRIVMTVDGHAYELSPGTYFQEVGLKQPPTSPKITMSFKLLHREGKLGTRPLKNKPENRLRISAASLVIER